MGLAVKEFFQMYQSARIAIKCKKGCFFAAPRIVGGSSSFEVPRRLKGLKLDKYDLSYLSLLDTALKSTRLSDRAIVFGSNDWKSRNGAQEYVALLRREDRVKCTDKSDLPMNLADP